VHPKIIAFFLKHLKGSAAEPVYSRVTPDKSQDLWCTPDGQVGGLSIADVIRKRADTVRPSGVPGGAPLSGWKAYPPLSGAGAKDFRTAAGITALPGAKAAETGGAPALLMVGVERPSDAPSQKTVVVVHPRPWPAGTESAKAAIQGSYYLLTLRAQITGETLVGLRADDIIREVDRLASAGHSDITAYASGPSGIALLHAAALDKRITRVIIEDSLASFRMIATEPLHRNAPESMIPGVLRYYDIPDLIQAISPRKVEFRNPVDATGEHIKESYRPGRPGSALAELMK
jgi:hypothetical protein